MSAPILKSTPGLVDRCWYLSDLLRVLVGREMKLRYRRSVLGIAWSLLNPLAQLLVLTFIFGRILELGIPNYTVFLFAGLLVWNWFQASLHAAAGSIVDNRDLIRRPGFPAAVLPAATITTHLIHLLLALPVLFSLLAWSGLFPGWPVLWLLPVLAIQFLFTSALGYGLAALNVTFRDIQYLLGIALMLGFYVSPVFYDQAVAPEQFQVLFQLNPLAVLLGAYRTVLLNGHAPDLLALSRTGAASLLLLVGTAAVFQVARRRFVEEL